MNIIIDIKENKKFTDSLLNNNIIFESRLLDIGDIMFIYNNEPLLIIERKTINDLASSLNDGRYHEQKIRLKNSDIKVLYVIEGIYEDLNKIYNKTFDYEKYKGCIINTMIRDDIPVYNTKNMDETIIFIKDLSKRLPTYEKYIKKNNNYESSIKMKKKDNITSYICYINQLRQIPNVALQTAEKISEIYPSMFQLIKSYLSCDNPEMMLSNIYINQKRKLGNIISKQIYEYLQNDIKNINI